MDEIKIGSLNVRGLQNLNKCKEIFNFFRKHQLDIVCIQESHSSPENMNEWSAQWGGQNNSYYSHGTTMSKGCMVLINPKRTDLQGIPIFEENGRIQIIQIVNEGSMNFHIVNIYAPNEDTPTFFTDLLCKIEEFAFTEFMIVGDFNTVLDC